MEVRSKLGSFGNASHAGWGAWGWIGFGLPRAGGNEGVESLDCFLVAEPKARFVAGHAIDFLASIAPSDTEEHVSYMTLVAGYSDKCALRHSCSPGLRSLVY